MTEEKREMESEEIDVPEEPNELTPEEMEKAKDKKIKNLISAIILLAGLFVGSLFVDIVQLVKGGGFSQRALSSVDVFSSVGKTWVAYPDPIVKVSVLNDDSCGDACKPDEVLVGLKQAIPTMVSQKIDINSSEGKKLAAEFNVKTLPAFIFSTDIEKTDLFSKAEPFMTKGADGYAIKSAEAGFPVGKYIAAPATNDKDIKIGADNAEVKVAAFSDFANPTDAKAWQAMISPMIKDYADKIQFVFKSYYPSSSTLSAQAALAAACANDQGKFVPFAEKLFSTQAMWSKTKDATAIFEGYAAQLGLKGADFNQCLTGKKDQDQIAQDVKDGQDFGIQSTPAIFVGADLQKATATYDDLKKVLDGQLGQ